MALFRYVILSLYVYFHLGKEFGLSSLPQLWLDFLIQHHPGFRDISIDYSVLLQLPDDSSILPDIESASIAEDGRIGPEGFSGINEPTAAADPDGPTTAAVPDTRAHTLEVDDLRRGTYFFLYVYNNHLRERITNSIPGLGIRHEGNAVPAFEWPRLDTFQYSQ